MFISGKWYIARKGVCCDAYCRQENLACSKNGMLNHNSDVDTSKKVVTLIKKLGGNLSTTNCKEGYNFHETVPKFSSSKNTCYYSAPNRPVGTIDCTVTPYEYEQRLCFCHKAKGKIELNEKIQLHFKSIKV